MMTSAVFQRKREREKGREEEKKEGRKRERKGGREKEMLYYL